MSRNAAVVICDDKNMIGGNIISRLALRPAEWIPWTDYEFKSWVHVQHGALLVGEQSGEHAAWRTMRNGQAATLTMRRRALAAIEPTVAYVVSSEPLVGATLAPSEILRLADTREVTPGTFDASYFDGSSPGRGFDPESVTYEQQEHEVIKKWRRIVERCHVGHLGKFLEAGCARGYLVHHMRACGMDAIGFDISQAAIDAAFGSSAGHITRLGLGIDDLPWPDHAFDVVHCWDTLEHIPLCYIPKALDDLVRLTKKWLIIRTPLRTYNNRDLSHDWSFSDPNSPEADLSHVTCMPEDFWVGQIEARGIKNDSVEIWNSGLLRGEGWLWFKR